MDCIICGANLNQTWRWTDYHGEFYCTRCGMIYDMGGYRDVEETRCRITDEKWLKILKEYWEETHMPIVLGTFITHRHDYAYFNELVSKSNKWIEEHYPEMIKKNG